jgi:hypothetical protein
MKRGDKSPAVKQLQETLITLGYPLPRWGADGAFGTETLEAASRLLREHGRADTDRSALSARDVAFILGLLEKPQVHPLGDEVTECFDLRESSDRRAIQRRRSWKDIEAITLHQTAVVLGEKPGRWQTLGAHLGVTREGRVMVVHGFEWNVAHANGFNACSVGIELDGHYEGVEGNPKTYWRPASAPKRRPQEPTPELIAAAKWSIRLVVKEVAQHGGRVRHIFAHRQSSAMRQSDPGSAIWRLVALPMMEELRLDAGKSARITHGTGRPIPEAWDARCSGVRY